MNCGGAAAVRGGEIHTHTAMIASPILTNPPARNIMAEAPFRPARDALGTAPRC
jgi:hypothetical protein